MEPGLLKVLILIGSLLFGLFAAANGSAQWENLLLFLNPSPFGVSDPLFQKDIGFYVFQLPFLLHIYGWLKFVLIVTAAATGFIYLIRRSFLFIPPRIWKIAPAARIHLALLVALFFFWGVFGAWLDLNDLLFTKRGVVFGPGYTDVTTQLWVLKLMMGLYALAGLAAIFFAFRPDWRFPAAAILLLIAVSVLGRGIYPSLIQKFQVIPNEIVAETPYLEKNIRYTRLAYGLTQIEEKEFPTEENLTAKDLEKNNLTVKNIRLWNHAPLLQTYSQLQEMRTYYKFTGVDNDRYTINGEYRQVMLSPREISYPALPSRTWVNEHLAYTHGYGVVLGPVNRISPEGLPEFFIKDIPPVSTTPLKVTRPEIYFGENSNEYVFVRTKMPEFDYPVGDKNVYSRYEGKGGVPLSFLKKLIFAVRFGSITMLLSDDITSESRIVYHRNVRERVSMIAPFAHLDARPLSRHLARGTPPVVRRRLHGRRTASPIRSRPRRWATTSATPSRRSSTPMTARSSSTSAIRPIPSCRPTAGSSPASSSRWARCRRRSGAMSAIRRDCWRSRRGCTGRTTCRTRRSSTTRKTSGPSPANRSPAASRPWTPTTRS